jgi:hypothetical protein
MGIIFSDSVVTQDDADTKIDKRIDELEVQCNRNKIKQIERLLFEPRPHNKVTVWPVPISYHVIKNP